MYLNSSEQSVGIARTPYNVFELSLEASRGITLRAFNTGDNAKVGSVRLAIVRSVIAEMEYLQPPPHRPFVGVAVLENYIAVLEETGNFIRFRKSLL
jgi:hypothetical protein